MNDRLWENLMPDFNSTKKPEVFIYYLQCRHDQQLDRSYRFWESYFEELGIKVTFAFETSLRGYL